MYRGHSLPNHLLLQESQQSRRGEFHWKVWCGTRIKRSEHDSQQVVNCALFIVLLRSSNRLYCVSYPTQQVPVGLAGHYDDDLCLHDRTPALVLATKLELRCSHRSDERMHYTLSRLLHDVLH